MPSIVNNQITSNNRKQRPSPSPEAARATPKPQTALRSARSSASRPLRMRSGSIFDRRTIKTHGSGWDMIMMYYVLLWFIVIYSVLLGLCSGVMIIHLNPFKFKSI